MDRADFPDQRALIAALSTSIMLKEERFKYILDEVHMHNRILLTDMADSLGVSIDTVRRDIMHLHGQKLLKKVHGGAVSLSYDKPRVVEENIFEPGKKQQIAHKAVQLLRDNQVVMIGDGTTALELARHIPQKLRLTIFTPSLPVAAQLLHLENAEVIMIGGRLSGTSQVAIGADTINYLREIRADLLFLGTGYLDATHGPSEMDWDIVQLKKAMIASAKKTVLITISDKINSIQRYKTCEMTQINTLITELDKTDPLLEGFKKYPMIIM